ncbi:MAG TPA: high frequency lysogenization protein HflD [Mariprofundaceae bacterium]|nr:high frequency lysogenization protein HflD [Mariprofundaceae bacterium]
MPSDHNRTDPRHHARNRAIAFAALVQAAYMVDTIARKGAVDAEDFEACVHSVLSEATDAPELAYGGLRRLHTGLHLGLRLLRGEPVAQAKAIVSYGASLMRLEQRLSRSPGMLAQLADGITRARSQADYFGSPTHPSVVAGLAALYGDTLSTLTPRIIIHGKAEHLSQSANTDKVRTLLLAGIRAAYLWRRSGGGRLRLLLGRRRLLAEMQALLKEPTLC